MRQSAVLKVTRHEEIAGLARALYRRLHPSPCPEIRREELHRGARRVVASFARQLPAGLTPACVLAEFEERIEPQQLGSEADYLKSVRRDAPPRLTRPQRRAVWSAAAKVYAWVNGERGCVTTDQMLAAATAALRENPGHPLGIAGAAVDGRLKLSPVERDFLLACARSGDCDILVGNGKIT